MSNGQVNKQIIFFYILSRAQYKRHNVDVRKVTTIIIAD